MTTRPPYAEPFAPVFRAKSKRLELRECNAKATAIYRAFLTIRDAARDELRLPREWGPNIAAARSYAAEARRLVLAFGKPRRTIRMPRRHADDSMESR